MDVSLASHERPRGGTYVGELGDSNGFDVWVIGLDLLTDLLEARCNVLLVILLVCADTPYEVSQGLLKHYSI